jgi:hypothetical protein
MIATRDLSRFAESFVGGSKGCTQAAGIQLQTTLGLMKKGKIG